MDLAGSPEVVLTTNDIADARLTRPGLLWQALLRLNRELEDTNRGVVALYAELDARAEMLRRTSETKTRMLYSISHECRTPINSIMALSRLVLSGSDGELSEEHLKQIHYIQRCSGDLQVFVNDLLDFGKLEAGKMPLHISQVAVREILDALRGAFAPLANDKVDLIFEEPVDVPPLITDEGKVITILRKLVSNALKFTYSGEIRVSVTCLESAASVRFSVTDTGVGIEANDLKCLFDEFFQVDAKSSARPRGTGLGLSMSKRIAELLGGTISVDSVFGRGSTFHLLLPLHSEG
jgi:signal transduction histidine kinase